MPVNQALLDELNELLPNVLGHSDQANEFRTNYRPLTNLVTRDELVDLWRSFESDLQDWESEFHDDVNRRLSKDINDILSEFILMVQNHNEDEASESTERTTPQRRPSL